MGGEDLRDKDPDHGNGMYQSDGKFAFCKQAQKDREHGDMRNQAPAESEEEAVQPSDGDVPLLMATDRVIKMFH